jgi:hypothetical protein
VREVILKRFSKRILFVLLVFFVALVGAVGAYAYLLNNQKSVGFKTVVNGYALEIDKAVYKRGEKVTITFTNNGDKTVVFRDAGWYIIRNSEGRQVAPGLVFQVVSPVPPGGYATHAWYQIDFSSEVMVPPGIYTVELNTLTIPVAYLSLTFQIVD